MYSSEAIELADELSPFNLRQPLAHLRKNDEPASPFRDGPLSGGAVSELPEDSLQSRANGLGRRHLGLPLLLGREHLKLVHAVILPCSQRSD